MAEIGNVATYNIISNDQLGNEITTNISKGFSINGAATYQQVDTASRALNALTTNTYNDTQLITEVSVNEKLAEEAAANG